jgi:hypothetical protein
MGVVNFPTTLEALKRLCRFSNMHAIQIYKYTKYYNGHGMIGEFTPDMCVAIEEALVAPECLRILGFPRLLISLLSLFACHLIPDCTYFMQ